MTDNEKIQEEFEVWWESDWMKGLAGPGEPLPIKPSVSAAFMAGFLQGQREAIMQYLTNDAQAQGEYDV